MTTLSRSDEQSSTVALATAGPALRVLRRGETEGRTVALAPGKWTIGSSPQCQVRLNGDRVRPLQCLVKLDAHATSVTRWASGVLLNGRDFTSAVLKSGDRLAIDQWELQYDAGAEFGQPEESTWDKSYGDEPESWRGEAPAAVAEDWAGGADWGSEPDAAPGVETNALDWSQEEGEADSAPDSGGVGAGPVSPREVTSHDFADRLILQLWTANCQARRRAKRLITSVRASRFQADALAADLAAMETELDLARAAYDSHLTHDERLAEEIAEQKRSAEERIARLVSELEDLRGQLAAAEASVDAERQRAADLADEAERLRGTAATAESTTESLRANELQLAELEAALNAYSEQVVGLSDQLRAVERERDQLAARLSQVESSRDETSTEFADAERTHRETAEQLAASRLEKDRLSALLQSAESEREDAAKLLARAEQQLAELMGRLESADLDREELTASLQKSTDEQERLAAQLHRAEAERDALVGRCQAEAERAADLERALADVAALQAESPMGADWVDAAGGDSEPAAASLGTDAPVSDETWGGLEPEVAGPEAWPIAPEEPAEQLPTATAGYEPWTEEAPAEAEQPATGAEQPVSTELDSWETPDPGDNQAPEPTAIAELEPAEASTETAVDPEDVPEYSTASFIDKYRHLLEEPESPSLASPTRPIIDDEFLSPSKVQTCASPADDSDEALEAYMASLMKRMRGTSVADQRPSGTGSAPAPSHPQPAASEAAPALEPFDFDSQMQATRRTPLSSDLTLLREIANNSARRAISSHSVQRQFETALSKFVVAITATVSAAYLMASSPAMSNWQFWAGVGAGGVGIAASIQVILIERRRIAERRQAVAATRFADQ